MGSFEPHGEPECAKFGHAGCSSRQRHKLHQPLRCNVLVPNGSCHYLSDMAHFDSEEIMLVSVKFRVSSVTRSRKLSSRKYR